jgi:hypothetical protein
LPVVRNQQVIGSSPIAGSKITPDLSFRSAPPTKFRVPATFEAPAVLRDERAVRPSDGGIGDRDLVDSEVRRPADSHGSSFLCFSTTTQLLGPKRLEVLICRGHGRVRLSEESGAPSVQPVGLRFQRRNGGRIELLREVLDLVGEVFGKRRERVAAFMRAVFTPS